MKIDFDNFVKMNKLNRKGCIFFEIRYNIIIRKRGEVYATTVKKQECLQNDQKHFCFQKDNRESFKMGLKCSSFFIL